MKLRVIFLLFLLLRSGSIFSQQDSLLYSRIYAAKSSTIQRVNQSSNILNKTEIVTRILNTQVTTFKNAGSDVVLLYNWNKKKNTDNILINLTYYDPCLLYYQLIHELAHLVDLHKKLAQPVNVYSFVNKFKYDKYSSFFDDWRKLTWKYKKPAKKPVVLGDLLATTVVRDRVYYLSSREVWARYTSLFEFLRRNQIIQRGEKLEPRHLVQINSWVRDKFGSSLENPNVEEQYRNFLYSDFIYILPLINWERSDEITKTFN